MAMAGLSVVLETPQKSHPGRPAAQIISKATLVIHGPKHKNKQKQVSSFLQRCFLCQSELAEGRDIYMYRGDRAFCSEDCRCRHILMDEDAGGSGSSSSCCAANGAGAATAHGRRRRVLICGQNSP